MSDLSVTIAEMDAEKPAAKAEKKFKPDQPVNTLGLVVSDLTAAQKKELKVENGVIVEVAEGAAARAGIRSGDLILRINNTDVTDSKQFNALVGKLEAKRSVGLLVRRGDSSQFVPVKPGNGQ
jgi:serine protease Do